MVSNWTVDTILTPFCIGMVIGAVVFTIQVITRTIKEKREKRQNHEEY